MEDDNKRSHLVERAAARLSASNSARLFEKPTEITKRAETATPTGIAKPPEIVVTSLAVSGGEQSSTPANGHSSLIDEAALKHGGLIDWEQPDNRVAEEFRILQNELLQQEFSGEAGHNIIMITSALQGEGKSFTALNLSAGIARHGQRRVLLVDFDYKAGALAHLLAPLGVPGLLDLAGGCQTDIDALTLRTAIENLDFLPVGTSPSGHSELMSSRQMGDLVLEIGRKYHDRLVILDSPPCLMSSAPNTFAAIVGQVVLVVEANATQEGDVNAAIELLHSCPNLSLVLNKIPPWSGHSFGSYYA
jgi:protein-tyrosine kinase